MKTVTKEFYLVDRDFKDLREWSPKGSANPDELNLFLSNYPRLKNKITISWEEEEKKITLSESEFDVVFDEFFSRKVFPETYIKFKQKLFGDKNE